MIGSIGIARRVGLAVVAGLVVGACSVGPARSLDASPSLVIQYPTEIHDSWDVTLPDGVAEIVAALP